MLNSCRFCSALVLTFPECGPTTLCPTYRLANSLVLLRKGWRGQRNSCRGGRMIDVFRIRDIFVYGSGCGSGSSSGSCSFRQWPSRRQQKIFFPQCFYAYFIWRYIYIILRRKKSHKTVEIKVFLFFACWWKDPDPEPDSEPDPDLYKSVTNPDPKTGGSRSGSGTLSQPHQPGPKMLSWLNHARKWPSPVYVLSSLMWMDLPVKSYTETPADPPGMRAEGKVSCPLLICI